MNTVKREIVAGLIESREGKFLLAKKDPKGGGVYIDCWHTPGGGVEEGESLSDALQREMLEEVGIDISPYEITLLDDNDGGTAEKTDKQTGETYLVEMHFHVFKIRIDKPSTEIQVQLDDELVEYQWVAKEDLHKLKLTPPSIKLFTKLGYLR